MFLCFIFSSKSDVFVYSPNIQNDYLWTQDWEFFHLCKSISLKAAYGCRKIPMIALFKHGEYFWPKDTNNIQFDCESNFYDINLESKDKINHQDFSKYIKTKCDKLLNLNDWLRNFITNDPILLTAHKVIQILKNILIFFPQVIFHKWFLDLQLPCLTTRFDRTINWLPRVQKVSFG